MRRGRGWIAEVGLVLALLLSMPLGMWAQSGTWTNRQSGAWGGSNNWLNGIIADSTNNTADFSTIDITTDVTNHLDAPRTIGRLTFGDANANSVASWTLDDNGDAANTLTLAGSTTQPGITVASEATIRALLRLAGGRYDVTVADNGSLTLGGKVTTPGGTAYLDKAGRGAMEVTGSLYGPADGTSADDQIAVHEGVLSFLNATVRPINSILVGDAGKDAAVRAMESVIQSGWLTIGWRGISAVSYDMHGGTLSVGGIGFAPSGSPKSILTIDQGASLVVNSSIRMGDNDTNDAAVVLRNGSVNIGSYMLIGIVKCFGVFNQLGGTVYSPYDEPVAFNSTPGGGVSLQYRMNKRENFGIYNLNGGTLTVGAIVSGDGTPYFDQNNAYFNFHGGELRPVASSTDFIRTSLTVSTQDPSPRAGTAPQLMVYSEGAVINTSGFNVGIKEPLVAPPGWGVTNGTIALTNKGAGYKATPVVKVNPSRDGANNIGATAVANMVDDGSGSGTFKIDSITISNPGVNYTTTPTIEIFGGYPTIPATPPILAIAKNVSGGLTKLGQGTLTLSATNTYTGDTIVNGGRLVLEHACLADDADLHIAGNATFAIEFDGEDVIHGLYVNGEAMPKGKYYSGDLGSAILGSGLGCLRVTSGTAAGLQLLVR